MQAAVHGDDLAGRFSMSLDEVLPPPVLVMRWPLPGLFELRGFDIVSQVCHILGNFHSLIF